MANWSRILDAYESWDYESLEEEACIIFDELWSYFKSYQRPEEALFFVTMCAIYFVNADYDDNGDESSMIRTLLCNDKFNPIYECSSLLRTFRNEGYVSKVEDVINNCPHHIQELFVRLGCVICSADGYVNNDERYFLNRWIRRV